MTKQETGHEKPLKMGRPAVRGLPCRHYLPGNAAQGDFQR
jgi:hypothetical protein